MENRKVSIKIRKGNDDDLDNIFECHNKCFEQSDRWYKRIVQQNLTDSYVVEKIEASGDKNIIGVMLFCNIRPIIFFSPDASTFSTT